MANTLTQTEEEIKPLKYLTTIDLEMVWEFYQPALEFAFTNEEMQGNVDKDTKKIIKRMRHKWFHSRMTALESAVSGEEVKSNKNVNKMSQVSEPTQPQETDLHARMSNVESQLKMCGYVQTRFEDKELPQLRAQNEELKETNAKLCSELNSIKQEFAQFKEDVRAKMSEAQDFYQKKQEKIEQSFDTKLQKMNQELAQYQLENLFNNSKTLTTLA